MVAVSAVGVLAGTAGAGRLVTVTAGLSFVGVAALGWIVTVMEAVWLLTVMTVAAFVATLAVGLRAPWNSVPSVATPDSQAPSARDLRRLAREQCARSEWLACRDDLLRAATLDRGGDTPDLRALRDEAQRQLHERDAASAP